MGSFRFLVCKKDDTGDEDQDGGKNEEEDPRFVRVDFIVEDERVQETTHRCESAMS